jgi:predicted transcriptional regulator
MKPIDYRNATWQDIRDRLDKNRREVWRALHARGPSTTRELASHMAWDILNVRPRVTELVQLGFAKLEMDNGRAVRRDHEGVYSALNDFQALALYRERVRLANKETQGDLFARAKQKPATRKSPRVIYRRLGRHRVWGFYTRSACLIELDEALKSMPGMELETLLHEGLHHVFPEMSEEEVERAGNELAVILWNHNYRRVSQ